MGGKARETLIKSHNVIQAKAGIELFNDLPESWMTSHSAVGGPAFAGMTPCSEVPYGVRGGERGLGR